MASSSVGLDRLSAQIFSLEGFAGYRFADQKPLHLVAIKQAQKPRLLLGFNSFRNDVEFQGMGEMNDRGDQRQPFRTYGQVDHERSIDFQCVHGKSSKVTQ
jgi:hypothetical protein